MDSSNRPGPSRAVSSTSPDSRPTTKQDDGKRWISKPDSLPIGIPTKNGQKPNDSKETERDDEEDKYNGEDFSLNQSVADPRTSAIIDSAPAPAYEVFSPEQVASQMDNVIKEVQDIIPQSSETVSLLLTHFAWNKERLLDAYFDGDNAEKLLADVEARIENPYGGESSKSTLSSSYSDEHGELQMKSFIESNPSFKWCPNPFCTKAIKIGRVNEKDSYIKCECGHAFCFQCEAYAHAPVSCELLRKWNSKRHIELEKLAFHEEQEPRSPDLRRFKSYLRPYTGHAKHLKRERKLYDNLIRDEQQNKTLRFVEVQFLKDAIDTVLQCRLAVMHTYVFEYYVEPSTQTEMFSKTRDDLQGAVKRLSGYLGEITSWDEDEQLEVKMDVQNLCTYCQSLRQVLIDSVHEGYTKTVEDGGWSLNEE